MDVIPTASAYFKYVSIDVPWNAPADFLDLRQLREAVWERDPDLETVERDAIVGQLKTASERWTVAFHH